MNKTYCVYCEDHYHQFSYFLIDYLYDVSIVDFHFHQHTVNPMFVRQVFSREVTSMDLAYFG